MSWNQIPSVTLTPRSALSDRVVASQRAEPSEASTWVRIKSLGSTSPHRSSLPWAHRLPGRLEARMGSSFRNFSFSRSSPLTSSHPLDQVELR